MRRFIPLIILLLVALGLLAFYGPGVYQAYLFRRTISQFISSAKAGDTAAWSAHIEPGQLQRVQPQLDRLPADYATSIASLKLTKYERSGSETFWAIVTLRLTENSGGGVYQGKLRWRWQSGAWVWDFTGSYAAPFSPSTEPDWTRLEDMLRLAEAYDATP
jgi:hypothetical protein